MTTKDEILKMNKEQLLKARNELKVEVKKSDDNYFCDFCHSCVSCNSCYSCIFCYSCHSCVSCNSCHFCDSCNFCYSCHFCNSCYKLVNGLFCRNLKFDEKNYNKYWILNVEVSKEEFEAKKKELGL